MDQYSDMSQQLQDFNLWEQDYFATVEMEMLSQGFPDSAPPESFFDDKIVSINPDAARGVSSPEAAAAAPGKAKRRRARAADAAAQSTTFLNASISNFRALVQQHTGCHNANSSPKGPITLCFAAPANHEARHRHHYYCS
ncbi:uncharacterized protein LOC125207727 [Salvia hispanica]|uniref:uncharacterized protein LOC125207727 n=1 Tax=Salvia hispanica TaxID=49212 RepID=UPI00200994C7|nr:uncharacterized protein LOC125207727 [Salvia hispanica]